MVKAQPGNTLGHLFAHFKRRQEVGLKLEQQKKTMAGCYLALIKQLKFSGLQGLNLLANPWMAVIGLRMEEDIGCNSLCHYLLIC